LIKVLDGGLKKWVSEKKPTTNDIVNIEPSHYSANEKIELVKNKAQINENILTKEFLVIDARSKERFEGVVPEPRKGLKSGSINNSYCLPFSELINADHTFIDKKKIFQKFSSIKSSLDKNIVFTCGSGVTAAVLALAYSLIDNKYNPVIYDGSWSEYGKS
jgi:thiosulfate/3-mercaptopyruvate sulfurtransferase